MRRAEVYLQERLAGILQERDSDYAFFYLPEYLDRADAQAVSLSLPLRAAPFEDKRLFPFFDGLIPEGWLLDIAEQTWNLNPRDRMGLLLACCRDCIGAVSIIPVGGPEDAEESALAINGRKRKLIRKDFLCFAESLRLTGKQVINAFARFSAKLAVAYPLVEKGCCTVATKQRYLALIRERATRLGLYQNH